MGYLKDLKDEARDDFARELGEDITEAQLNWLVTYHGEAVLTSFKNGLRDGRTPRDTSRDSGTPTGTRARQ